jgi:beta-mannanase
MRSFTATAKKATRTLAAVAVLAGVACTLQLGRPSDAAVTGPRLVPTSGALVGLHVDNAQSVDKETFKNGVDRRELDAGRKVDILAAEPYSFTNTFPSWREPWIASTGHIPLVSWSPGYSPAVANGSKDAILNARAADVRAYGQPLFLSYGPSMNKEGAAVVGTPASFVSAWRRAHDRFAAANATNAVWVWCPSAEAWSNGSAMSWYPGDAYVDWTCAEGTNTAAPWTPFTSLFRPFVDRATTIGKPQMVTFGSREGAAGQKATWVEWAFKGLTSYLPTVKAAVYDDRGATSLSTSSAAASAFSGAITDPALYAPPAPSGLPGGKLVPAGRSAYVGTYQPSSTQVDEIASIGAVETAMGRKEDIAHVFYGFNASFPTWRETWNIQNGRIPMISWAPARSADVNAGVHDATIRARARGLKALPGKVFLRWFWEMDGATNAATAGSPAAYIAAWQRIHAIFQQEGVTNVAFVWSPNAWGIESGVAQAFYPGDAYVDWIAADGYNWAPRRVGAKWLSFTNTFSGFYAWAAAKNKPLMIAEVGVMERNPGEKTQWIKDMGTSLKVSFPKVRAVVYFDASTQSYSDGATVFPWNLRSSAGSISAWKSLVALPYLAGSTV